MSTGSVGKEGGAAPIPHVIGVQELCRSAGPGHIPISYTLPTLLFHIPAYTPTVLLRISRPFWAMFLSDTFHDFHEKI